jgi:hypothetical protein
MLANKPLRTTRPTASMARGLCGRISREGALQQDQRAAAGGNPALPGPAKLLATLIVGTATFIAVAGALVAAVFASRALIGGMPW